MQASMVVENQGNPGNPPENPFRIFYQFVRESLELDSSFDRFFLRVLPDSLLGVSDSSKFLVQKPN
jgi:hypothetical protein